MAGKGRLMVLIGFVAVGAIVGSEVIKMLTADTVRVEVATVAIPMGTQITSSMVQSKPVHTDGLEPEVIKSSENIVGKYTTESVLAGQQLTGENVDTGTGKSGLETTIRKGDVMLTIPDDNVTGLTSSLQSGDFVDVLGSVSVNKGGQQNTFTNFVATNAPVLGVVFDPTEKTQMDGVEVEVTPLQAARIQEILASTNGTNNGFIRIVMPGYANRHMKVNNATANINSVVSALQ